MKKIIAFSMFFCAVLLATNCVLAGWGEGSGGGSGDITDVFSDSSGDVSALTADSGDSLDMSSGSYSIPVVISTDCSSVTGEGRGCWDSDDDILYMGSSTAAVVISPSGGYRSSILLSDLNHSPTQVGELLYDNTVQGLVDGTICFYDDDEVRCFPGITIAALSGASDDDIIALDTDTGSFYLKEDAGGVAGPGGSANQVQVNIAGSLSGDAGLTYNATTDILTNVGGIVTKSLTLNDTNHSPDAVGEVLYDNTVTGLEDGAIAWHDDDEVRYIVDLDTLPSTDDYVVAYDAPNDKFYMKADNAGSGNPSGNDTEVQWNDGGSAFGAEDAFKWTSADQQVTAYGGYVAGAGTDVNGTMIEYNKATGTDPAITWDDPNAEIKFSHRISVASSGSGSNITFQSPYPTKMFQIQAGSGMCRTTNGCSGPTQVETAVNYINDRVVTFADGSTTCWQKSLLIPKNYVDGSSVTSRIEWFSDSDSTSGGVSFDTQIATVYDNHDRDVPFGASVEITDDIGSGGWYQLTDESAAISIAGSGGYKWTIQTCRDGTDGDDDLAGGASNDVHMSNQILYYQVDEYEVGP